MDNSTNRRIEVRDRELAGPLAPFRVDDLLEASWSHGYERTEITERLSRQQTANDFPDHVRLWTRSLGFTFRLFDFLSEMPLEGRTPLDATARQLRFRLFTISVGSMKVGLDCAVGGYYAQAWGQIRFLAECMLQMMHARFREKAASRWFGSRKLKPGQRQQQELTCEHVIEAIEAKTDIYFDREDAMTWEAAKRLYKLGHKRGSSD